MLTAAILVPAIGIAAGILYVYYCNWCEHRRRQQFEDREILEINEWINRYYPEWIEHSQIIESVIRAYATALQIKPGQLRPDDRFDREFSLPSAVLDDTIDCATCDKLVTLPNVRRALGSSKWRPGNLDDVIQVLITEGRNSL